MENQCRTSTALPLANHAVPSLSRSILLLFFFTLSSSLRRLSHSPHAAHSSSLQHKIQKSAIALTLAHKFPSLLIPQLFSLAFPFSIAIAVLLLPFFPLSHELVVAFLFPRRPFLFFRGEIMCSLRAGMVRVLLSGARMCHQ